METLSLYDERTHCRVCGGRLTGVLDLGRQASWTIAEPLPLEMMVCEICELLQLRQTVARDALFRQYGYRSGINNTMMRHLSDLAQKVCHEFKLTEHSVVVDIGANDGFFLRQFDAHACMPNRVGFEPARNLAPLPGVHWITDYFSAEAFRALNLRSASVVTSLAMFYDADDPIFFAREVAQILDDDGVWIIEVQDADVMLSLGGFDTICHEHLCYYTEATLALVLDRAGLGIAYLERVPINGGSMRVYATKRPGFVGRRNQDCAGFAERARRAMDSLRRQVAAHRAVWGYGASTKGNVILQACGFMVKDIVAIADKNPEKWGQRTPGSHIPICSEAEMRAAKPDALLILPWSFAPEFRGREKALLESGTKLIVPFEKTYTAV
jgi:C-methyltransferase-like protein/methyltransferase family protein